MNTQEIKTNSEKGTGNSILSGVERFCSEPITSTWGISDSAIEKWYLSQSNVKSKNAKYNLNADNIREVTNAVRAAGIHLFSFSSIQLTTVQVET